MVLDSDWSIAVLYAVHGQGLFFSIAEGRLLVILLHESCTNTYFFNFNIFIVW